jgi:hypothetical protein
MQAIEVKLYDDRHWHDGEGKVQAHVRQVLEYNGKRVKLDLSDLHHQELAELLQPWLAAGQPVDAQPTARLGFRPGSSESRAFYAGLRTWADENGRGEEYQVKHREGSDPVKVNYHYPESLLRDYENHLAGRAALEMARQVA